MRLQWPPPEYLGEIRILEDRVLVEQQLDFPALGSSLLRTVQSVGQLRVELRSFHVLQYRVHVLPRKRQRIHKEGIGLAIFEVIAAAASSTCKVW